MPPKEQKEPVVRFMKARDQIQCLRSRSVMEYQYADSHAESCKLANPAMPSPEVLMAGIFTKLKRGRPFGSKNRPKPLETWDEGWLGDSECAS